MSNVNVQATLHNALLFAFDPYAASPSCWPVRGKAFACVEALGIFCGLAIAMRIGLVQMNDVMPEMGRVAAVNTAGLSYSLSHEVGTDVKPHPNSYRKAWSNLTTLDIPIFYNLFVKSEADIPRVKDMV